MTVSILLSEHDRNLMPQFYSMTSLPLPTQRDVLTKSGLNQDDLGCVGTRVQPEIPRGGCVAHTNAVLHNVHHFEGREQRILLYADIWMRGGTWKGREAHYPDRFHMEFSADIELKRYLRGYDWISDRMELEAWKVMNPLALVPMAQKSVMVELAAVLEAMDIVEENDKMERDDDVKSDP